MLILYTSQASLRSAIRLEHNSHFISFTTTIFILNGKIRKQRQGKQTKHETNRHSLARKRGVQEGKETRLRLDT